MSHPGARPTPWWATETDWPRTWRCILTLGSGAAATDPSEPAFAVLADFRASGEEQPAVAAARSGPQRALELIQAFLAEEQLSTSRLVFVTQGAVAATEGDGIPDLPLAPAVGARAIRSVRASGRFVLVDLDGSDASMTSLRAAVASGEPQLAVRQGRILVPQLARARENWSALISTAWLGAPFWSPGAPPGSAPLLAGHLISGTASSICS